MPELPEVETCCRGLRPHLEGVRIMNLQVREQRLRWPVPKDMPQQLMNQTILSIERRAKYILMPLSHGSLIIHLGMSGSLRLLTEFLPPQKHDHIILQLANHQWLYFNDPRRFGAFMWVEQSHPTEHPLFSKLGVEPLSDRFDGHYLWTITRNRKAAIKLLIMDQQYVVGVGNIYANEALFAAKINPSLPAQSLSLLQTKILAQKIKLILTAAIRQGGTTLRNFVDSQGKPGYFKQSLKVYGRGGEKCLRCKTILIELKLGQRSTVYCPHCQVG